MGNSDIVTLLCILGFRYGTDKTPLIWHVYTPFYYNLFKDRVNDVRTVVEFGVGYKPAKRTKRPFFYQAGASLKMWRDFFPFATVYGLDNNPAAMIQGEERIKTILCDEHNEDDVRAFLESINGDVDLFIDDASHKYQDQIQLCKIALPLLKKEAVYVIEDVIHSRKITNALSACGFKVEVPELKGRFDFGGKLVVVSK